MAKDGLLGKDLLLRYMRDGKPFTIETEKFNEKQKQEQVKKHPLGEQSEHTRNIYTGWEIDTEGEVTGPEVDDLIHDIESAYRNGTPAPFIEVFVEEVYGNGEIRKWKYTGDGGVRISGFEKDADGGGKARKYKFKIDAQKRERVE